MSDQNFLLKHYYSKIFRENLTGQAKIIALIILVLAFILPVSSINLFWIHGAINSLGILEISLCFLSLGVLVFYLFYKISYEWTENTAKKVLFGSFILFSIIFAFFSFFKALSIEGFIANFSLYLSIPLVSALGIFLGYRRIHPVGIVHFAGIKLLVDLEDKHLYRFF